MTTPRVALPRIYAGENLVLRLLLVWGAIAAYGALWGWFFFQIWTGDARPVDLSPKAVYAAAAIGSVLAGYFAVAVGVRRQDPSVDVRRRGLGHAVAGRGGWEALVTDVGVYLYGLIGIIAFATVLFRSEQSPEAVETLATSFFAVVVAVTGSIFAPGQNLDR